MRYNRSGPFDTDIRCLHCHVTIRWPPPKRVTTRMYCCIRCLPHRASQRLHPQAARRCRPPAPTDAPRPCHPAALGPRCASEDTSAPESPPSNRRRRPRASSGASAGQSPASQPKTTPGGFGAGGRGRRKSATQRESTRGGLPDGGRPPSHLDLESSSRPGRLAAV